MKKKPILKLKENFQLSSARAFTSAEPSKKNIIIAFLFILVALISQNFLPKKPLDARSPASVSDSGALPIGLLDKYLPE